KTDGTLDTSFGSSGLVQTAFGSEDSAAAVTVQTDGKIVSASNFVNQIGRTTVGLARWNADGTADASFGIDGQAIYPNPYNNTDFTVRAVAEQPDGKLLTAGATIISLTTYEISVIRFNADGSVDGSFGSGGRVDYFFNGNTTGANAMAL